MKMSHFTSMERRFRPIAASSVPAVRISRSSSRLAGRTGRTLLSSISWYAVVKSSLITQFGFELHNFFGIINCFFINMYWIPIFEGWIDNWVNPQIQMFTEVQLITYQGILLIGSLTTNLLTEFKSKNFKTTLGGRGDASCDFTQMLIFHV